MRLDADDFLSFDAVEKMVHVLEENPGTALVFPDYFEVDEYGDKIRQIQRHNFDKDVTLLDQPAHGACTMFLLSVLVEVGGYDENFNRQDGYDIWLAIAHKYNIKNINIPLFYYRKHANSLTRNESVLYKTRGEIIEKHVNKRFKKKLNVLCVIPVRGEHYDSRSFPLSRLGDKYLIDWTIKSALSCEQISKIIISTPDLKLNDYIDKTYDFKVTCLKRNTLLAKINLNLSSTIKNILSNTIDHDYTPDAILILNPDFPFRNEIYIRKAINVLQLYNLNSVIGVRCDDDFFYRHDGNGLKELYGCDTLRLERNELYRKTGGITLVKYDYYLKHNKIYDDYSGHVILDKKAAIKIDSQFDLELANSIINIEP